MERNVVNKAMAAKTLKLPEWVYEGLARKAVESFTGSGDDLVWGGCDAGGHDCCRFGLEEDMEIGGRMLWLCLSGEIGVDITDESFTHDFGTEYRTGYELTGLESVGEAQAYDAETDERVKLLFDYRLFTRKVNAMCN